MAELPHCEVLDTVVLQPGPAIYQVATLVQCRDPQTGRPTQRELHLNDFPFRVLSGMRWAVKDRLAHWACGEAELQRLAHFLNEALALSLPPATSAVAVSGDSAVASSRLPDQASRADLRDAVPAAADSARAANDPQTWVAGLSFPQLAALVSALADQGRRLRLLPSDGEGFDRRAQTAAALRAACRATAVVNLRQLIDRRASPAEFRAFLQAHPWTLGRLYLEQCSEPALGGDPSELLLLRTADAGLDVVLLWPIDTPLAADDPGGATGSAALGDACTGGAAGPRPSPAASSGARRMTGSARWARPGQSAPPTEPPCVGGEVARAVSYAAACVAQLTQRHSDSLAAWGVAPARICARVVLGYLDPLSPESAAPRRCLQDFNDSLSGIEVFGYDRLVATAEDVLEADLAQCGVEVADSPTTTPPRRPLF